MTCDSMTSLLAPGVSRGPRGNPGVPRGTWGTLRVPLGHTGVPLGALGVPSGYLRVPRVPGYPRSVRATQVNTITQVVKLLQGMLENSKEDAANDKESWYGRAWECVFLPGL